MFISFVPTFDEGRTFLFNDALSTFYLRLYGVRLMIKDNSNSEETLCRHIGCSFRLAARVLLYVPSYIQDSTYHGLCYTSRGALAGTKNSSMGTFNEADYLDLHLCLIKLVSFVPVFD